MKRCVNCSRIYAPISGPLLFICARKIVADSYSWCDSIYIILDFDKERVLAVSLDVSCIYSVF